ncbi:maleylpyruvate isomerase family mycothiol-dependent enzyme [Kribbella sp. NBC_01245]|uniref:maleylpyruvate isomerase family mycothiol-dependent enzyme n=1 Tax=Kribbella sp. NBC_01245 TaxID=2903578 RepID=UPI002E281F3A|nr:maleylpyruvate isomerase family mycothiol-dependent enzyme [Kribbella sp. NBC_01245]
MTEIKELIADERRELAELLRQLPTEDWDRPTLCEGWRVREVVAHMTMPYRYSMPRILLELAKSGGRFNPMSDRLARKDAAAMSAKELTDCLAANVNHPWKPPGGGLEGALSHDVIHGLDITVALGLDRKVPAERLRIVLEPLSDKHLKYFGTDLTGIRLQADDLDWSYGTGPRLVTGSAQDLLLAVCGRDLPTGHLQGAARLTKENR